MNSSEYQLLKIDYSEEDKKNIEKYNNSHLEKAFELLKFNREKLLNDTDYKELELVERMKFIQASDDFKEFCKTYPIVSKYMVCFGLFSKKSFVKYINWISVMRPSDDYRKKIIQNPREQHKFKNKYIYAIYVKYLYQEKTYIGRYCIPILMFWLGIFDYLGQDHPFIRENGEVV